MPGKQYRRCPRTFRRADNRTYISYIFHTVKKNEQGILSSTRRKHLFQISIYIRLQRRGYSLIPDTFCQTVKRPFLSPGVVRILQEKYNLMAVTTPEQDLKAILGEG